MYEFLITISAKNHSFYSRSPILRWQLFFSLVNMKCQIINSIAASFSGHCLWICPALSLHIISIKHTCNTINLQDACPVWKAYGLNEIGEIHSKTQDNSSGKAVCKDYYSWFKLGRKNCTKSCMLGGIWKRRQRALGS